MVRPSPWSDRGWAQPRPSPTNCTAASAPGTSSASAQRKQLDQLQLHWTASNVPPGKRQHCNQKILESAFRFWHYFLICLDNFFMLFSRFEILLYLCHVSCPQTRTTRAYSFHACVEVTRKKCLHNKSRLKWWRPTFASARMVQTSLCSSCGIPQCNIMAVSSEVWFILTMYPRFCNTVQ